MIETLDPETSRPTSPTVEHAIECILRSPQFRGSAQLQTLLKYLVEATLKGQEDALKERIIGIDVFRRKSDYDTADDPIVRSRIGLLRKRLGQYYESQEGKNANLQVVIPSGSYRPTFVLHPKPTSESSARLAEGQLRAVLDAPTSPSAAPELAAHDFRAKMGFHWRNWSALTALACALIVLGWVLVVKYRPDELALIWGPVLSSQKTVLLYNGTIAPVYITPGETTAQAASTVGNDLPMPLPSLSEQDSQPPPSSHLVAIRDGLMPPGDIAADLRISNVLSGFHRELSLRSGGTLPFVDLKGSPTVLIGAYDNYWTLSLAKDLPFYFDRGIDIRERGGRHRAWSSQVRADSTIGDDFAIVFRLVNSKTGGPVMGIAGLTTCGTLAAAEFVTDPAYLKKLTNLSRNELKQKNLEFVLHASLENCSPTSVDVIDQRVW